MIGQAGLEEELDNEGVAHIGGTVRIFCFPDYWRFFSNWSLSLHLVLPLPLAVIHPSKDPADNTQAPFSLDTFELDPSVGAVLCGLDTAINYTKLSKAMQYITRNPGCLFLTSP